MADTINARFRALRKRLDLTIAQMADVLGLSPSGISAIECAQRNVTDKHIRLLASLKAARAIYFCLKATIQAV